MQLTVAAELPASREGLEGKSYRSGSVDRQWLLADGAEDGLNFRVFLSSYKSDANAFQSPRHHHGFQQLRWTAAGSINYAPDKYIEKGELAYFPRGAYYGPQVKDQGVSLLIQFGFGAELSCLSLAAYREGEHWKSLKRSIENLESRGRIENGVFIDVDPETGVERRRDSGEAVAREEGRQLAIPAEGYDSPILMHPAAFGYYEAAPGVEIRNLGSFFDHPGANADLRVETVRLSGDGCHVLAQDRAQVAWTVADQLVIDGAATPETTYLYSPRGEEIVLSTSGEVEIWVVTFPRLD